MFTSTTGELRAAEAALKALANQRGLRMVLMLRHDGEMHVGGLAGELRLPFKTVSRNLRLLERAGLELSDLRQGRVFYRLNPNAPFLGKMVFGTLDGQVQV